MNKLNSLILLIVIFAVCGCSFFDSTNKSKSSPTPAKTSPVAENSAEPTGQTKKSNTSSSDSEIAQLEAKIEKNDRDFEAYFQLGKKHQSLKNEEKAVSSYKKAIEISPDFAEANYELGKIYYNKKELETSLPFLQKAAKIKYTSAEYLVAHADNLRALKRCNDAIPPYGNSINFNDKNPAAYYGMGLCYIELKNTLAAEAQIRPLEKLDKNLAKQLEMKLKQ